MAISISSNTANIMNMAEKADRHGSLSRQDSFGYEQTLMYGRYTRDLGDYVRKEAARSKEERIKEEEVPDFHVYKKGKCAGCKRGCVKCRDFVFTKIGEDWIFLAILGIVMALMSFLMDFIIEKCQEARVWMYEMLKFSPALQYFAWVLCTLVFICFSTGFVHIVAPNAIGSGIPEMKTIMRGVILKEYLTFRTLISKMVGLCATLGSGLPIGKEGPFVHIASITATLLSKLVTSFRGIFENESRNSEMLAAACAVGVACTFAAPIGGVLFSIEVTATFFAVRNYWRGFFSAVCAATMFRLLAIWFKNEATLTALFKTNLRHDFPFDPQELIAFAFVGLISGFGGALFVYVNRKIVEIIRKQTKVKAFLQKSRFIFPAVVALLITSITFPLGFGQFMVGELPLRQAANELFSNITWAHDQGNNIEDEEILRHWRGGANNIYVTLTLFIIMRFWMSALCITLPTPAGVFMPVFTIGAGFGRLMGESMAAWFPNGITVGSEVHRIVPGGYAVVGAAAFAGAVTHTISTSVIVFELTGQIGHILPAVIAVLIANAVAHGLQPSIYDSMIRMKGLPFLPDIHSAEKSKIAHQTRVDNFMVKDVKFLSSLSSYKDIKELLKKTAYKSYPLVDTPDSMILLGSVHRAELDALLQRHIGRERKSRELLQAEPDKPGGHKEDDDVFVNTEPLATSRTATRFSVSRVSDARSVAAFSLSSIKSAADGMKTTGDGSSKASDSGDTPRITVEPVHSIADLPADEQLKWEETEIKKKKVPTATLR